jgi:LPXTG-motif cell wall-anchored protein
MLVVVVMGRGARSHAVVVQRAFVTWCDGRKRWVGGPVDGTPYAADSRNLGEQETSMLRRILPVIAAASAVTLMPVGSAVAHDDDISATCESLSVELFNYSAEAPNVNTVQIWMDGAVVEGPTTFGSTFSWSEPFADPTMDHTYRVSVIATMFPEATFDTGVQNVDGCPAPTTTTTMAPTTTTTTMAPTTTTTTMAPTSTTTTMAPTSTTTTTAVASAGGVGTTTLVAPVGAPSPPDPAAASPASATLPATGAEQNNIALVALGVLLVGGLLTAVAVRSRPRS